MAGDASPQSAAANVPISIHPSEATGATPIDPVDATMIFNTAWTREADTRTPIGLEIHRSGQGGLAGGGFAEVLQAAQKVATQANLTVEEGRATSTPCFTTFAGDGRLVVAFGDPCGEMSATGGTLVISGTWVNRSMRGARTGDAFIQVLQAARAQSALPLPF